ncbi:single-pass membrane and coiled-coil domain-containing protein 4 isoform X2 [Suricata suricatta]|uniref:single-pass membrane and coiled-coil domain-containing protein 4 isoform X2 n=1 Tax=Suricata suricatta TaxID=37032 RepID=UPI00115638BE|nr:single-pass membrane and coiled-coil domain-containing protein 4 isoform X2 [Suricata suricatta]
MSSGTRVRPRNQPSVSPSVGRDLCDSRTCAGITQVTFTGNQFAESLETAVLGVEEKFSPQEVLRLDQRSVALPSKPSLDALLASPGKMRQLKGKPKKETSKDKKERKQAMQEARQQITTVVLPTLAVVVLLIVVFVYVATRPAVTE